MAVIRGRLRSLFPDLGARTLIMGILNVTPDSFSDGGELLSVEAAVDRALEMMDAGADLLDLGGESSRPGADPVPLDVELSRVLPVVEALARHGIGPISVDTTKAEVARRALDAGASIINDISAMTFDPEMAQVVASQHAPVILMHTRGRPGVMQQGALDYPGGVVQAVRSSLADRIRAAHEAGVAVGDVIIDPGLGFGKTIDQNVDLLKSLGQFADLGCPVLVGPSKKSFLGALTAREVHQRAFATAAAVALAIARGAHFVRVHDVGPMGDVVRVADAISREKPTSSALSWIA